MLGHREDIPEIMAALDIHCVASFAVEGTTQVIPQAFAMKTPVVSKNPQNMANAILKLLNEPKLGRSMAEKAYTFCKNELSIDRMMDQTIAVYQEALSNSYP